MAGLTSYDDRMHDNIAAFMKLIINTKQTRS